MLWAAKESAKIRNMTKQNLLQIVLDNYVGKCLTAPNLNLLFIDKERIYTFPLAALRLTILFGPACLMAGKV